MTTTIFCAMFAVLTVWDYPSRQVEHGRLRATFVQASRAGNVNGMEAASRKGTELLPEDPTWAYNLACALARGEKQEEAFNQLEKAIDLGFRRADVIAADADFAPMAENLRFQQLVEYAKEMKERPILVGPLAVTPAKGVTGSKLTLGRQNLLWDFNSACFVAQMSLEPGAVGGNAFDLYMNRDGGHSSLVVTNYPGLTPVRFDAEGRSRKMDLDYPNVKFPYPVFGNCSRAYVHGVYWRSIPRAMMSTEARRIDTMASFYMDNQIWVFPANADYPPIGTNGDVFVSVTPYWLVTQGRSWSDQYYLKAALEASRSLDPDVKSEIVARRLLAPTIMTLIRKSLKGVESEDDYLTEKAHPTCLPPNGLDLARLKSLAGGMSKESVPPVVRIVRLSAPVKEKPSAPEVTYMTPYAGAFVLRASDEKRQFAFAADGAEEFAFRIVHDPLGAGQVKEQRGASALVEIDRTKLKGTARVDLAIFGRNQGTAWGAPSYVSFSVLDLDAPYYDQALAPLPEMLMPTANPTPPSEDEEKAPSESPAPKTPAPAPKTPAPAP